MSKNLVMVLCLVAGWALPALAADPQPATAAADQPADAPKAKAAEPSNPDKPLVTEEVTVTARKREETKDTVPVAVSVVSGDDLVRNDVKTVADASKMVPSLNITSDSGSRAFVSIRGIGTALFNTVQPGVGVFLDGVYLPSTAYVNNPTLDVERIEVLRGPQGTLYGKNTLGGAINIITRKPTDTVVGDVTLERYGGDDSRSAMVRFSGPLVPGQLWGRVSASKRRSDGFFKNTLIGGAIDASDSTSFNGSLLWKASDAVNLTVNAYDLDLTAPEVAYGAPSGIHDFSDDIYKLNDSSASDIKYKGGSVKLDVSASARSKVSAIVAYDEQKLKMHQDADFSPVDLFRAHGTGDRTSATGELRFDTTWSDEVSTLFGVFGSRDRQDNNSITTVVPFGLDVPDSSKQTTNTYAGFATVFYRPSKAWELTAGLRYDNNKSELDAASDLGNPHRTLENSDWAPRVSATRYWNKDAMTYFSLARGVREGGFNSTLAPENLWIIRPDKVWSAELGHKLVLNEGRTHLAGALFYTSYSDFIGQNTFVLRADGNGYTAAVVNQGDARSYGAEFEFSSRLTQHWSVGGDAAWIHARAINQDGWVAATGAALATDRLIFQPDWTYNLRTEYGFTVGKGWLSFRAAVFGKGDSAPATQKHAPDTVTMVPSYTLLNAGVSYTLKHVTLQLYGSNLTDEGYWASYIDESLIGSPRGIQGPKRRIGVQLIFGL